MSPHDPTQSYAPELRGPMTIGQDVWEGGLKVIEEAAEVTHEMVKLCVFPGGVCPDTDPRPLPERVESELGDLLGAVDFFLARNPSLDRSRIEIQRRAKVTRFQEWSKRAHDDNGTEARDGVGGASREAGAES